MKALSRTVTAVAAIGLLTVSLTACGNNGDTSKGSTPTVTESAATQSAESSPSLAGEEQGESGAASRKLDAKSAEEIEAALTGLKFDGMEVKVPVQSAELTKQTKDLTAAMKDSQIKITPEECGLSYESNLSKEATEDIDFLVGASAVDVESDKMLTVTVTRSKSDKLVQQLNNPVLLSGKCDDVKVSMGSMGEMSIHSEFSKLDLPNTQVALLQRGTGNEGMPDTATILAADGHTMLQVMTSGGYSDDELKAFASEVLEAITN